MEIVPDSLEPRYNIAPSQPVPILLKDAGVRMALFQWGLIPPWAKDPSIGNRMINARRETLAERPSFRDAFRAQRCLVIADGFYEWRRAARGPKTPYYVRLKSHEPFTFAGLWSRWRPPSGDDVLTCTIVTGDANELLEPIHDRMPVVIPPANRDAWLDPEHREAESLLALLRTGDPQEMEMYPVSRYVNSPANEGARCIEVEKEPEEPPSLFGPRRTS